MNIEQAIKILEQALNVSAKAGVFNITDASTINSAIETIKNAYFNTLDINDRLTKPEVEKEVKNKK